MWKKWNKEKKNKIEWAIADDNDVIDDNTTRMWNRKKIEILYGTCI